VNEDQLKNFSFQPGDKVTEFFLSGGYKIMNFAKVERVTKTKVVLDSGAEWNGDGEGRWGWGDRKRFGCGDFSRPHLLPFEPEHVARKADLDAENERDSKRKALIGRVYTLISDLTDEDLGQILADYTPRSKAATAA